MNWQPLFDYLRANGQSAWARRLEASSTGWLENHGDYPRWAAALAALPEIDGIEADFDSPAVTLFSRVVHTGSGPLYPLGVEVHAGSRDGFRYRMFLKRLADGPASTETAASQS